MPDKKTKLVKTSDPLVSVIVVNYKTKKITADTISSILADKGLSLKAEDDKTQIEIILVDNNSEDDSVQFLRKKFRGKVTFISAKRNIGFGPANNLAANQARGTYLFFLNSDTLVQSNCIQNLTHFLDHNPEYGVVSPTIYLKGLKNIQPASFGKFPSLSRIIFRTSFMKRPKLNLSFTSTETDWVTGAAMMIPKDVYWAVGGFDSRYFMYFEDQDLCADIKKLGYKVAVVHNSSIVHLVGKSMKKGSAKTKIYDLSQEQFYLKHYGWFKTSLMIVLRWPWKLIRAVR